MKQPTRPELIHYLNDPWENLVKPFLDNSPMSSNVIAGHADISASAIRALRNGNNKSPNAKQLAILLKFVINQTGIE